MRGLVVLVLAAVTPGTAHAGRSFYGWLYGTEVMPERGAELQTWVSEENRNEADRNRSLSVWGVGPLVGITDQLELALPVEVWWQRVPAADGMPAMASTVLHNYGLEARYRMVTQDPEEAPPFAPLVRVAVRRLVVERDTVRPEVNFVGSFESGSVHVAADIGLAGEISRDTTHFELRPGAGVSVSVVGDLRLGAETFARISLDDDSTSWAVVGPNVSWTHGRFWVSGAWGFGVHNVANAPRVQWGIAF